jgi:biopolymer transport protein ExbB/TolQ
MEIFKIIWANSPAGKIIILTVVFLGIVAGYCAYLHRRRYRKVELGALNKVRSRLKQEVDANPNNLVQIERLRESVKSGKSLIDDRLAAIGKMRQASVKVNINTLQQMSLLKESSNISLAIPAYVVGLAMMLGLLGTFIGLALMAQDLQILSQSAQVTTLQGIRDNLRQITGGLKTGFSASLVGLTCSITVSAFNFLLARAQSEFYDEMERFTTEELLPKTVPAVEDTTLLEEVSQQLNNGFARLETITQEHTQNVEHLKAMEEAFNQIIVNIKEITHREANASGADFVNAMTGVIRQLTEVNQAVVALTQHIPSLASDFQKTQQETLDRLGLTLKKQQDQMERLFMAQSERLQRMSSAGGFGLMAWIEEKARSIGLFGMLLFAFAICGALLLLYYWIQAF